MGNCNCEEERKKERQMVTRLVNEIDYKNKMLLDLESKFDDTTANFQKLIIGLNEVIDFKECCLLEIEKKYSESSATIRWLMNEKNKLHEEHSKEVRKMQFFNGKLENDVETRTKELEVRAKELQEIKKQNELEQSALNDKIEEMERKLQDQKLIKKESDLYDEIDALQSEIEEKNDAVQYLESLNHILVIKDCTSNEELQEARKVLINELQDTWNDQTKFSVKRMGEVDQKPFQDMCLQKFPNEDYWNRAAQMCSSWQEQVKNPIWHPFKIEDKNGIQREIVNEDDETLKRLRVEFGEHVYNAVANALLELNEYNPSGRYAVPELWNLEGNRKANLKEVIQFIIKQLRALNQKRKRT